MDAAASAEPTIHTSFAPREFGFGLTSAQQHIGRRAAQEDRFFVCPRVTEADPRSGFFCVLDGTVGDFASDTVQHLVLPEALATDAWKKYAAESAAAAPGTPVSDAQLETLRQVAHDGYKNADDELIRRCGAGMHADRRLEYASTTVVTGMLVDGVLTMASLGDSMGVIGVAEGDGHVAGWALTQSHKPDQPNERARIEASGGSVEYLHNSDYKPFIRGGDFTERKRAGGKPMQLQYSRAFGGRGLKPYGLSNEPTVQQLRLDPSHRVLIIASDGLWDVCSEQEAVNVAMYAHEAGTDAAQELVDFALEEQARRGSMADNVTVVCVFFKGF